MTDEERRLLKAAWDAAVPGASLVAWFAGWLAQSDAAAEVVITKAERLAIEYVRRQDAVSRLLTGKGAL